MNRAIFLIVEVVFFILLILKLQYNVYEWWVVFMPLVIGIFSWQVSQLFPPPRPVEQKAVWDISKIQVRVDEIEE